MKKIIHLTDTHIGYKKLNQTMGLLVDRLILHKQPASNYVIVITGDLVDDATQKNAYKPMVAHIQELKQAGFEVLLVPGNHDYGTGSIGHKKYVPRFKKAFFGNKKEDFPKLDIIDDIAFIGLDSMEAELHWLDRFAAEGDLGEKQLTKLENMLQSAKVKACTYCVVYLHHHPLAPKLFHHLKDADELGEILRNAPRKIDALLFGHNHAGKVWNGHWGISRVYDGGTSTGKGGKPNPHRIIDLSKHPSTDYDADL
ncbi:metallophosphoesterase family protein [Magnetococcales bacterium HHB-1]